MSLPYASTYPINVVITSYDTFIANGLASSLQTKEGFSVRGTLATEEAFERVLRKQDVDVLLIHPQQVDASLYEMLHALEIAYPHTKKILLLPHEDLRHYLQAINMSVQGVLIYPTMTLGDLCRAIHEVHKGKLFIAPLIAHGILNNLPLLQLQHPSKYYTLTTREAELLSYLVEGLSNREMATKLQIEMKTVKNHLTHIYSKLQVRNRLEAAVYYYSSVSAQDTRSIQSANQVSALTCKRAFSSQSTFPEMWPSVDKDAG